MSENLFSPEITLIGRFLKARRRDTRVADYADLPMRRRHAKYLSQEEMADLTGISSVLVSQIEQGRYTHLNNPLLARIADTLRITYVQRIYLFGLAQPRTEHQLGIEQPPDWVRHSISNILHPTIVVNPAFDILAMNELAEAFYRTDTLIDFENTNTLVNTFNLIPADIMIDQWENYAVSITTALKLSYARHPAYRNRIDSVVECLADNELFMRLWNDDRLAKIQNPQQHFENPSVGRVTVFRVLSEFCCTNGLARVELIPADAESLFKMERLIAA